MSEAEVSVVDELKDVGLDPVQAYERGKVDINFFAGLALPEVSVYALPQFYIQIWQVLVNRHPDKIGKILRFALGLPRGHAKTTFIKILLAWLIVYDKVSFVLIICATESLAENLLADLSDILGSPNIEEVYGKWNPALKNTQDLKKAIYHGRGLVLAARGAGSALRGLNIKHQRPDCIFCDDAQTRENDASESERTNLLAWLTATLFKTISTRGDRFIIYVGNMYSEECILRKLQNNPQWLSLVTGAILVDGQPLWPELFSLEDLMESFEHDESLNLADLWFAEVMNDPVNHAVTLLPTALDVIEPYESDDWDSTFITIDPAGFRASSDQNIIQAHGVREGKGHILQSIRELNKPDEIVLAAINIAVDIGASLIGVESVGYQQTLGYWLNYFMQQLNITDIAVVELKPHGRSKESRIKQFIQECYAGNYCIYDAETRAAFVWQALKYRMGAKKNKDDLLDACSYGLDIRNEYWQYLREPARRAEPFLLTVLDDNTPF